MRSVSVRRGCFGKRCKKESIRQRAPKRFSKKLREVGIRTAVGSSSRNTSAILQAAGLEHHFDVCVDGLDAEALRLPGKPDPALFLEVARRLDVHPSRIILFEDALAGVEAGRTGRLRMRDRHRSRPATWGVASTRRRCCHQELVRGARRTKLTGPSRRGLPNLTSIVGGRIPARVRPAQRDGVTPGREGDTVAGM